VVVAITSQNVSVLLYTHPTYDTLLITVVVINVNPSALNAPAVVVQVIDLAVPLSFILINSFCPFIGVQLGCAKVIEPVNPSATKISVVSPLIVSVPEVAPAVVDLGPEAVAQYTPVEFDDKT